MTQLIISPFDLIWRLVAGILLLVGRFVAVLVGLILAVVGIILTVTLIGAIVGIPLIAAGAYLFRLGLS